MRNFIISAFVLGAFMMSGQAVAADDVTDRNAAIALCRAEVASQAGLSADEVRFDQVRTRLRHVRVDFDIWRDGRLTNVRCDVTRNSGELQIASISPALTTATASAR